MIHHTGGCDRRGLGGLGGSARTSDASSFRGPTTRLAAPRACAPSASKPSPNNPRSGASRGDQSGAGRGLQRSLLSAALRRSRAGRNVSGSRTTRALQLEMSLDPLEPALRVTGEYLEPIDLRFEPIGTRRRDPDRTGSNTLRRLVRRDIGCCRVTFTAVVNSESRLGFSTPI